MSQKEIILQQIFKCAKRNLQLTLIKNMPVGAAKLTDPRVKVFNSHMKYSKLGVILTIS
jgi:hypothetical protein